MNSTPLRPLEHSIRQLVSRAVASGQVIDIFAAAGLKKPDISVLSDEFLVEVLGEPTLKTIARELVATVKKNVTIDWAIRENVQAHLRVLVKRVLRKYGYPPDLQEKATLTVLEQAGVLSTGWAEA